MLGGGGGRSVSVAVAIDAGVSSAKHSANVQANSLRLNSTATLMAVVARQL